MKWMNLEPIIQSEASQKEKDRYRILMHIKDKLMVTKGEGRNKLRDWY